MAHLYQQYREKHPGQKKAKERYSHKATGGPVSAPASKPKALATGGSADLKVSGFASGGRLDKYARGGKAKGKGKGGKKGGNTKINILVAPGKDKEAAPGMPPPDMGAAPPPMPPKMPLAPPPGGPMGGPPGMPGMPPPMKRGGAAMNAGADSGVGRLQKAGKKTKGK